MNPHIDTIIPVHWARLENGQPQKVEYVTCVVKGTNLYDSNNGTLPAVTMTRKSNSNSLQLLIDSLEFLGTYGGKQALLVAGNGVWETSSDSKPQDPPARQTEELEVVVTNGHESASATEPLSEDAS